MKKDNTLLELVTGIILVGVVVQIVCLIAFRTICIMRLDCEWSGNWKRNGDSYEALHRRCIGSWRDRRGKHVRMTYALRVTVVLILMGCVFYFDLGNPLTLLAGLIALKISAYLQRICINYF